MQVIGAGLPRTGTLTQKVALEMLGFGPCYHMVNVFADMDAVTLWQAALDGDPNWELLLGESQAIVDWPGGFFYRELAEAYPDAKVLLSARDPETWERSMRETVWGVYHGHSLIAHMSRAMGCVDEQWHAYLELMNALLWSGRGTLARGHRTRDGLIEAMERHEVEVRATIAPERLLVWDVTEGWDPLCEFLGVDAPATPVPHLNDGRSFRDRVMDMSLETIGRCRDAERSAPAGSLAAR